MFFGVLYHAKENSHFFQIHGFKTVPYLAVSLQKQKRLEGEPFYKEEDKWLVRSDQIYDVHKILEFLNGRLNTDVKLVYPFSVTLMKNITFFAIVTAFLFLMKYIRLILLKPASWFAISLATFCICTGGLVYAIIHNVPWFKFERNEYGQVYISEYFMKGQRGQWAGEGYIVSFLTCLCGIILTILSRIDRLVQK